MSDGQTAEATEQTVTMESLAAGMPDDNQQTVQSDQQQTQQPASGQPGAGAQSDMAAFIESQRAENEKLANQLAEIQAGQSELQNSIHRDAVNKAVDDAVSTINDKAGGDPEMAEYFLSKAYNNDPNLQRIFANREQYPEAYKQALGLLATEWEAKNQVKIDPQVAENQRALKDSQQGSGGQPNEPSTDEKLEKMSDEEFLKYGHALANNQ